MKEYQIEQHQLPGLTTAVVRSTLPLSEIGSFIARALESVGQVLASHGMTPTGPPFARYHLLSPQEFDVEVGFPTSDAVTATDDVSASSLPPGVAAVMTYVGPYEDMEEAYGALAQWIVHRGGQPEGDPWEIYLSDPAQDPDPETWRTEIVMPFRA